MEERILLVEDEEKLARMVELELRYEGYEVEKAFDGRTGLERALSGGFDLVLLDIMLPQLSGMEVLRRLRPDLVVERFASEAPPRYHYGRNWGLVRNEQLLAMLEKRLEERNVYQGEIFTTFAADKLRQR